jgi:hypothetical protein
MSRINKIANLLFQSLNSWSFSGNKFFSHAMYSSLLLNYEACLMVTEEFKALTKSLKEMTKDQAEFAGLVKSASTDVGATRKLWKGENKPWLIRAGVALVVMPDPLVTSVIGAAFLAAGAVQEGIKRQSVYVDDLPKAFQSAMKTLKNTKDFI